MFGFDRARRYPHTELGRALRMQTMLADLEIEVETEARNVEVRYRHAVDDAAFSLQALDNSEGKGLASRVDMLSRAVEEYSRCAARLQQQLAVVRDLRARLDAFVRGGHA